MGQSYSTYVYDIISIWLTFYDFILKQNWANAGSNALHLSVHWTHEQGIKEKKSLIRVRLTAISGNFVRPFSLRKVDKDGRDNGHVKLSVSAHGGCILFHEIAAVEVSA